MGTPSSRNDARRFLFVQLTNDEARLACLTAEQLRGRTQSPTTNYRVSPIFPVLPGESKVPPAGADYYVGFLFFEDPSFTIGKLIAKLPKPVQKGLWFSHGLASVILFTTDHKDFALAKAAEPQKFRGIE